MISVAVRRARTGLLLAAALVLGVAAPAAAAPSTEVVQGQYLRIVSVADWQAASVLGSGSPVSWDLSISADAPEPGTVAIGVRASGGTPLLVDVMRCSQAWEGSGCQTGAETLRSDWAVPRDGSLTSLLQMADTDVAHLRLLVALAEGAIGEPTSIHVQADGAADSVIVGPGGELPQTGMDSTLTWMLAGGAVLLVLVAVALMVAGRRRSSSSPSPDDEDADADSRSNSGSGSSPDPDSTGGNS